MIEKILVILTISLSPIAHAGEWCGAKGDTLSMAIPEEFNSVALAAVSTVNFTCTAVNLTAIGKRAAFYPSCQNHDICYLTIGTHREDCDKDMHKQLRKSCKNTYDGYFEGAIKSCCNTFVGMMYNAAKVGGEAPFEESQMDVLEVRRIFRERLLMEPTQEHIVAIADTCLVNINDDSSCKTQTSAQIVVRQFSLEKRQAAIVFLRQINGLEYIPSESEIVELVANSNDFEFEEYLEELRLEEERRLTELQQKQRELLTSLLSIFLD